MRKNLALLLMALLAVAQSWSQEERQPDGGGPAALSATKDELTPEQRQRTIHILQANEQVLRQKGKLPKTFRTTAVSLQWPLRQAPGFYDQGYYGISNYIDHNAGFPNQIRDYNCGIRSYDLSSGYNHKGTDIFTWPFSLQKMQKNAVQVIAAAAGTILGKDDGNYDQNCDFCSSACDWNAVYIMHTDGSIAWYGHLKSGSLTTKLPGDVVAAGEYLGVVGSSGNSTGPHLHLEIYTNNTYSQLVDPWAGPCNALNGTNGWWANQQSYYVPTLNKLMTHGLPPQLGNCPGEEITHQKTSFVGGETIYLGSYYRDQRLGQQSVHTVYRPDGTVFHSWMQTANASYNASWWYYIINLPWSAMQGMWRYTIAFNGNPPQTTYFSVNTTGYVFTGNGNWSNPLNWLGEQVPPAVLPTGHEIIIAPIDGGECIVDQPQQISSGGKFKIESGKKLTLAANLTLL